MKDKNAWEKFYTNEVEPYFNDCLNRIIYKRSNILLADGVRIIDDQDKQALSLDLAIQIMRGKISCNKEIILYNKLLLGIFDIIDYYNLSYMRENFKKILQNENTFKEISYSLALNCDLIKNWRMYYIIKAGCYCNLKVITNLLLVIVL